MKYNRNGKNNMDNDVSNVDIINSNTFDFLNMVQFPSFFGCASTFESFTSEKEVVVAI